MDIPGSSARVPGGGAVFATTCWSMVLAAAGGGAASGAMESLCRAYWHPVYSWIRRRGHGPEDARDLAQGFFAKLISREALAIVDRPRGRFRWFLLTALKHHLSDERDRAGAAKRGGGASVASLDEQDAEGRYLREPADGASPDLVFDRRWAWEVLDQSLRRLREEFELAGRGAWFEWLQGCIVGEGSDEGYADLARRLRATEGSIKMAVQRARRRFRELVRGTLAATLADPADIDDELDALRAVLREVPGAA